MEIPHKNYLIVPGARRDELDRWMPVVLVRWRSTQDGTYWTWPAKPIVSERHKSRVQAERRSLEIAKQMIDRGEFRPGQRSRFP